MQQNAHEPYLKTGDKAIFTPEEEQKLAELLSRAVNPDQALTLDGLHGFLFGLAITPEPVMPNEWFPQVFGEGVTDFASDVEANETLEHLFSAYHRISLLNEQDELTFPFDMDTLPEEDLDRVEEWSYGLYLAMSLRLAVWVDDNRPEGVKQTEDEWYVSVACCVILGVAVPDSVPELFSVENEGKEQDITDTLYAALPEAVATLREHGNLLRLGLRRTSSWPTTQPEGDED